MAVNFKLAVLSKAVVLKLLIHCLSYYVASGSEITPCNKIDKQLLLHKQPCRTLSTAMF